MKKFLLISPKNRTVYNFRGDLIKEIKARGYEVIVVGPNKDNIEKIQDLEVKFIEVPLNKNGINPFSDLKYMSNLYKIMRREKIESSLGYTIKPIIYGGIAAKLAKVKNISAMVAGTGYLFASNNIKAKILRKISSILYRISLSGTDNIIFQNKDDQKAFEDLNICKPGKSSVVNGSGVNMTKFKSESYPDKPIFFFLGRFIYHKGLMDFLKAAETIKNKYPDVQFNILGKFENMNDAIPENEINYYIDNNIVNHYPETDNIVDYYNESSVFVLPTYYREGVPRVILEAMACARPIITTYTPGCKETVIEGQNGFFVNIKDHDDLAEKFEYFIKNPESIKVMGEKSLQLCKEKFDVNIINLDMLKIMGL